MPRDRTPPPLLAWFYAAVFLALFATGFALYGLAIGDPLALLARPI